MKGGFLLNVVIIQSSSVFQLLPGKDEALLVGRDTLLILDFRLHIIYSIRSLDLQSYGLAREGLDKNLHAATEPKDQVKGRLLLDIVVGKGATVLELFSGKDEALLVGRDTLLVLDLRLNIVDGVGGLDLESNGLAGEGLHEDLHATTEAEDQVERRLLLNVAAEVSDTCLMMRKKDVVLTSRSRCDHLQAVYRRRSSVVGRGGCPPCPGSWP